MSNMVYLMTSLPALSFGQVPPITIDDFYDDAKKQLSDTHLKALDSVDIKKLSSEVGVKRITSFIKTIREDLSEIREARQQNRQAKLERIPQSALRGNPLEREMNIMHWQWKELQDMEAGNTFTLTEVLVYKLKLQILERLHSFNKDKGAKVLSSVVTPGNKTEGK